MKGGNVAHDPQFAVLQQLAKAHDRFAEDEQMLRVKKRHEEANTMHGYALVILRAYMAEKDDPKPESRG